MRAKCLLLALLLAAPGAAAAAEEAAKGPRIAAEPEGFDFGKALPRKILEKEFRLRNLGDAPLVIEKVATTCGCTVAEGWSRSVEPGESTTLRVSLDTRDGPGRVVRKVIVDSNDRSGKPLVIEIVATVVAEPARESK